MRTFVEICVDFGDAHFVTMEIGSKIALQEYPAYGQQVSLHSAQLLGCKSLTVYNTSQS